MSLFQVTLVRDGSSVISVAFCLRMSQSEVCQIVPRPRRIVERLCKYKNMFWVCRAVDSADSPLHQSSHSSFLLIRRFGVSCQAVYSVSFHVWLAAADALWELPDISDTDRISPEVFGSQSCNSDVGGRASVIEGRFCVQMLYHFLPSHIYKNS